MKRIQFDLPDEDAEELEHLREIAGASSAAELLQNSLSLYRWAVTETKKGRRIQSTDPEHRLVTEVTLPGT